MRVYRIVKNLARTRDLSGNGAFRAGGRWNDKGSYVLYTSETSSLALLENVVHFDNEELPEQLYIMEIEIDDSNGKIFTLPQLGYPEDWKDLDNLNSKSLGDDFFKAHNYLGLKVRSALNPLESNILLDPLFAGYHELVQVVLITEIKVDTRFGKA
ncbi:RES family NAD+ phosphorylase [Pedobacter aquatilis]|uniref:RES family NAD+ phosphorylase n=1 Tax=Pedobacter aquatilis TaxID=351343 RepID=UPI00292F3255|nr:RES family NAD+ phosphorylase [Pedobacter aquatilis]